MKHQSSSFVPLFLFFLTPALTILTQSAIPDNLTSLLTADNSPATPSILLPETFLVHCHWSRTIPLDPLQVYLTVIQAIYELSLQQWDVDVDLAKISTIPSPNKKVFVWLGSTEEGKDMQPRHLIVGLRRLVLEMARKQPGFYSVRALLINAGRGIGKIQISKDPAPIATMPSDINSNYDSMQIKKSTYSLDAKYDSGQFTDVMDPLFQISWHYDGLAIPSQEVFTAIIHTQTMVASCIQSDFCDTITGYSILDKAVLDITRKARANYRLRCGQISRFLVLATNIIMGARRFGEVGFTLSYAGEEIAGAVLFRPRPLRILNNATDSSGPSIE